MPIRLRVGWLDHLAAWHFKRRIPSFKKSPISTTILATPSDQRRRPTKSPNQDSPLTQTQPASPQPQTIHNSSERNQPYPRPRAGPPPRDTFSIPSFPNPDPPQKQLTKSEPVPAEDGTNVTGGNQNNSREKQAPVQPANHHRTVRGNTLPMRHQV